jgi:hypothetical protein
LGAVAAETVVHGFPVVDDEAVRATFGIGPALGGLKVRYAAAAAADQMGVRVDPAVEAFLAFHYADGYDGAFFQEQVDVTVHGTQRKAGDRGFELVVYPLGAGMGCGGSDCLQDGIPLFAVLPFGSVHKSLNAPLTIIKLIMIIIINITEALRKGKRIGKSI